MTGWQPRSSNPSYTGGLSRETLQPTMRALEPCTVAHRPRTQPFLPGGIVANHQLGLRLQALRLGRDEDHRDALGTQQSHPQSPRARVLVCGNPHMVIGTTPADNLLILRAPCTVQLGVPRPKSLDMLNLVDRILEQLQRRPEPPTEVLVQKEAKRPSTRRRRSNPSRLRPARPGVRASQPRLRVNRPRGQRRSR